MGLGSGVVSLMKDWNIELLTGLTRPLCRTPGEPHALASARIAASRGIREASRAQLRLTGVVLPLTALLPLPALPLVALMGLLALPLVTLGVGETLPLVALGLLLICFRH